jgi:hypothetical protein
MNILTNDSSDTNTRQLSNCVGIQFRMIRNKHFTVLKDGSMRINMKQSMVILKLASCRGCALCDNLWKWIENDNSNFDSIYGISSVPHKGYGNLYIDDKGKVHASKLTKEQVEKIKKESR